MLTARLVIISLLTAGMVSAAKRPAIPMPVDDTKVPYYEKDYPWVDSLMQVMTLDQKIGQLFMAPAYSNKDEAHAKSIDNLVTKYQIGGLIFMQGGPVRQAKLNNRYQKESKIPLLIGMDAEWGPAMRLDSVINFQRQLTWGAMSNDSIVYEVGTVIAQQLKRLGVHVNFAPDIDINNNPNNPVIGDRSFGENKYNVALKGLMYMNALQDNHIVACGKHFPGHGDVDADSHLTLPVVNHPYNHLDTVEFFPFKVLMNEGLGSIMLAHLYVPALDSTKNQPSSLSPKVGRDLVRERLGFKGLIFSDALNMKGASAYYEDGELEVKAFLAGNDMLLFSDNIPVAFEAIKKAVASGRITQAQIDESVKRILIAKAFAGLNVSKNKWVAEKNITDDINKPAATLIKRKITENSITLANAADTLIPFKKLDTLSIACISVSGGSKTTFQEYLAKYAKVDLYQINKDADATAFVQSFEKLKNYDVVIVGVHDMKRARTSNYGITSNTENLVWKLSRATKTVVCMFGTPYAIDKFSDAQYQIVSYDDDNYTQQATAMALFGAIPFHGRLPVGMGKFKVNAGIETGSLQRIKYTIPEEVGIIPARLNRIDSLAKACIKVEAAPGCQVLVLKDGNVIYDKAFGSYKYDNKDKVDVSSIYDLASVTKTSATTIMLMDLHDKGLLNLQKTVSDYLPETEGTNIAGLKMQDILTHQAGLPAWVPFYKRTLNPDGTINPLYYSQTKIPGFTTQVADGIYMRDDYKDSVWNIIEHVDIKEKKYLYSDLSMYIGRRVAERIANVPLDVYLYQHFYGPLGMQTTCFNPLQRFPKARIVPTENDNYFRYQTVQGYVHDMGAAMMGGVEGHAGLFSDAEDLAILYQMLLNKGYYGGTQYFSPETVALWTKKQSSTSRRGLGFDKPEMNGPSPCSGYASASAFGHQGFTGICVWVDPEYNLVYLFLSNRVQPKAEPNRLSTEGIRNKIMDVIYEAILTGNPPKGSPASD
ncbi:MAG TPA: glycoside hydrolase family 3 N-terminal domain-containing protein [Chitinophagales bacterium]|nr:serine hydrolase [Chitinophagales bacterium]HMX04100.1 glycoside hydrolase family 3 N-terminal domain-containing protein [Chitinophagales bacterium]HNE45110.1 glycoside hydrolase family 3 N-terminal domain-containing protein [Chitinophagales bacterium]HNF68766.1 glycoside hydrolase family 3 N-terminal domain-containing protein [Chitinophagales bacterium]HNI53379.1 glycoside hydrolase family 3 N-terminal domain-containing protein [Chitinophagales bacterium]